MRTIGYARLSSTEQAEGQALEQQIDWLKKAGTTAVIHDLDSGSKDKREGFTRWNTDRSHHRMERWCPYQLDVPNWTARGFLVWALNPTLRGAFVAGVGRKGIAPTWQTVVEDELPPLIEPAIHRVAVARWMGVHQTGRLPSSKLNHTLTGLVRCEGCCGAMHRGGQYRTTGMAVRLNCHRSSCAQRYKNGFREDQLWPQLVKVLLAEHEQIASLLLGQAAAADRQSPSPDAEAMARLKEQRAQLMDIQQQGLPVADALRAVEREVAAVKSAAIAGQSKSAMSIAQLGQEILRVTWALMRSWMQ